MNIACDCGCGGTVPDLLLMTLESRFRYGGAASPELPDIFDLAQAHPRRHRPTRFAADPEFRLAA